MNDRFLIGMMFGLHMIFLYTFILYLFRLCCFVTNVIGKIVFANTLEIGEKDGIKTKKKTYAGNTQ